MRLYWKELMDSKIIARLRRSGDIKSVPAVLKKILDAVYRDRCSTVELGRIIEKDQALAAKVLRLANSAYYGLSRRVDTISRAVTILGFKMVRNIAITASVYDNFVGLGNIEFDGIGLWTHSLATAIASKELMGGIQTGKAEQAFLSGILHDIGIPFIVCYFQEEYEEICQIKANDSKKNFHDAEKEVLGCTHAEIGWFVCDMWYIPNALLEPIRYHHDYELSSDSAAITAAVHCANEIVKAMGLGSSVVPQVAEMNMSAWELLGINDADLPQIILAIKKKFILAQDFINL